MPTYEYSCPAGHEFEVIQKINEKPRTKCPVCGKPATRKISGGAALVFKGSGFYITDYGKDGKGPRKDPVESVPASTAAKPDATPAPKPAVSTPSEPKPKSKRTKADE
ncbi:MAG: FmdB family zinc ribbon protein [Gemmatimonadales bacterium]